MMAIESSLDVMKDVALIMEFSTASSILRASSSAPCFCSEWIKEWRGRVP